MLSEPVSPTRRARPSRVAAARFRRARRSAPFSPLKSDFVLSRSDLRFDDFHGEILLVAAGESRSPVRFPLYPRTINANTATPMVNIANSTSATLNSRLLLMSGHTTLARATSMRSLLFLRADWTRSHLLVRADSTKSHLLARAVSRRSQFFVRADSTRSRVIVGSTLAIDYPLRIAGAHCATLNLTTPTRRESISLARPASYRSPPVTTSIFVRSNSHAARQRTCRKCRSEPGCMPGRLNSISISVWSGVTNSRQTEHITRVPGPPNVRSGRRLGSLPLRIAARAISRSTGSSSSNPWSPLGA